MPRPSPLPRASPAAAADADADADDADAPAFLDEAERALAAHLAKRPGGREQLPHAGIFLRGRRLAPAMGLKRFILSRPAAFAYFDHGGGRAEVALAGAAPPPSPAGPVVLGAAVVVGTAVASPGTDLPRGAAPARPARAPPAPRAPAPPTPPPPPPAGAAPAPLSEPALERALLAWLAARPPQSPASLPSVGEHCLRALGTSMRGRLKPFLAARPHLFAMPDDSRQQVLLADGYAAAGGAAAAAFPGLPAALDSDSEAPPPGFGAGGGSGGGAGHSNNSGAGRKEFSFATWDALTQESFRFLRAAGGSAPLAALDGHMRATMAGEIERCRVPLDKWRAGTFLQKRRAFFSVAGSTATIIETALPRDAPRAGAAVTVRRAAPPAATYAAAPDAFPPLPGAGAAALGPVLATRAAVVYNDGGADGGAADVAALEALRDEAAEKLRSLAALSELQKENAGLRAACMTLGRELLGVKEDLAALRAALAARLGADFAAAPPAGGGAAAAATPPAAGLAALKLSPGGGGLTALASAGARPGDVVLIGGHDGAAWLDAADRYDASTGAWSTLPRMGAPRAFAAAAATPSTLFVVGGGDGENWYASALALDLAPGGGWCPLPPLATARGSLAAALAAGRLFAYGGGKPGEQFSAVEWLDPAAGGRWLPGPDLRARRFALGGAALGGAIWAAGGYDGSAYLATVERLDPREGRWEAAPPMAAPRGGHALAAAPGEGCLYALGGYAAAATAACEVFDARAGKWRPAPPLGAARAYGAGAATGGAVLALGGLRADMAAHAPLIERWRPAGGGGWEEAPLPAGASARRSFLAAAVVPE
jgi:hypothetical protein